nr:MAG TPA: hypothetical protein [Caudoviricetes sp.]
MGRAAGRVSGPECLCFGVRNLQFLPAAFLSAWGEFFKLLR